MSVELMVQKVRACFNCLTPGHNHNGKTCSSTRSCKTCGKRPHTLLHREETQPSDPPPTLPAEAPRVPVFTTINDDSQTALFMTCQAKVSMPTGVLKVRAIIDSASALSFVTNKVAVQLQARKFRRPMNITRIQDTQVSNENMCTNLKLTLSPVDQPQMKFQFTPAVVSKITTELPIVAVAGVRSSPYMQGLKLADPEFDRPGQIDMLLGVDVFNRIMLILNGVIALPDVGINAYQTIMGWTLIGNSPVKLPHTASYVSLHTCVSGVCRSDPTLLGAGRATSF